MLRSETMIHLCQVVMCGIWSMFSQNAPDAGTCWKSFLIKKTRRCVFPLYVRNLKWGLVNRTYWLTWIKNMWCGVQIYRYGCVCMSLLFTVRKLSFPKNTSPTKTSYESNPSDVTFSGLFAQELRTKSYSVLNF